jgi:hypothetical protein
MRDEYRYLRKFIMRRLLHRNFNYFIRRLLRDRRLNIALVIALLFLLGLCRILL